MSIGKLAFAGFALVVLALVSGCDGWTEEIALEALQTEPSFDRSDPVIKAVTEADNTVKKIKEADSLLEVGLTTHELAPLREAAKLRPKDPTLQAAHVTRIVMLFRGTDEQGGFVLTMSLPMSALVGLASGALSSTDAQSQLFFEMKREAAP